MTDDVLLDRSALVPTSLYNAPVNFILPERGGASIPAILYQCYLLTCVVDEADPTNAVARHS